MRLTGRQRVRRSLRLFEDKRVSPHANMVRHFATDVLRQPMAVCARKASTGQHVGSAKHARWFGRLCLRVIVRGKISRQRASQKSYNAGGSRRRPLSFCSTPILPKLNVVDGIDVENVVVVIGSDIPKYILNRTTTCGRLKPVCSKHLRSASVEASSDPGLRFLCYFIFE